MSFEEWWKTHWFEDENKEMAKAAYRAGLLHAAEQDEEEAERQRRIWNDFIESKVGGPATDYSVTSEASAAMHRQAASEVK